MLSHTQYGYSLSARKQAQVHTSDKNISTGLLAGLLVEDDPSMVGGRGWGGGLFVLLNIGSRVMVGTGLLLVVLYRYSLHRWLL